MTSTSHQILPHSGPAREELRQKGQFWTPKWVAEPMVAYTLLNGSGEVFDPAVGEGAFLRAAKIVAAELMISVTLRGTELDAEALVQAEASGLTAQDLAGIDIQNFILNAPKGLFKSIVANPPYIRHHRLDAHLKSYLKTFSQNLIGKSLDGRAGLHIYFLLQALEKLAPGGRLAFIVPADTCEGVFAKPLWQWIVRHYRLEGVVTFAPEATPFPKVDTNAIVLFLSKDKPAVDFHWARVYEPQSPSFRRWVISGFATSGDVGFFTQKRDLAEGIATGLSRPPQSSFHEKQNGTHSHTATLGDYVSVMRGIATGANEFFFLTPAQAKNLELPEEFFRLAVGRTRDVTEDEITCRTIEQLDNSGRPTRLLALDGRAKELFPKSIQEYLSYGESLDLPNRALIKQRKPWYKMEKRQEPPFLFSYLGRRDARFIKNSIGVLPLTGFLCIYPKGNDPAFIEKIWSLLKNPELVSNLHLVGKSYGGGAIKVEPRSLEQLPIPKELLRETGLAPRSLFD